MKLNDLLQLQALQAKAGYDTMRVADMVIDGDPNAFPELRQMCAKVSPVLIERLNEVCARLDLSKRRFIEAAVIEAIDRAHEVMERNGLNDLHHVQGSL